MAVGLGRLEKPRVLCTQLVVLSFVMGSCPDHCMVAGAPTNCVGYALEKSTLMLAPISTYYLQGMSSAEAINSCTCLCGSGDPDVCTITEPMIWTKCYSVHLDRRGNERGCNRGSVPSRIYDGIYGACKSQCTAPMLSYHKYGPIVNGLGSTYDQ